MMRTRVMHDPMAGKPYEYTADLKEEHLLTVLEAACGDSCPPENIEYLCDQVEVSENNEIEVCAQCYRNWANKLGPVTSAKAKRLMEAIELALADKCPPETKDFLCQASEDEDTSIEQCARCIMRWATLPFGQERIR